MVRGSNPKKYDPAEKDAIVATTRIPVELYNQMVDQIIQNKETLEGPITISEFLLLSARYCLEEGVFSENEAADFKLFGE